MTLLDLRGPAKEMGLEVGSTDDLSEADRAQAIGTWIGRMVNEHISARVFSALVPQMMRAGLDPRWTEAVATMASDELRHGRQCAAVVEALGGEAVAELPPITDVPTHDDCSPLEAVLRNLISISCLSETVAVSLIRAEKEESTTPGIQEILDTILADEVQHARFGWRVLDELSPSLDPEMKARLGDYLIGAFHHLRTHELAHLPLGPSPSEEAERVGVCDGLDARRLFFDTVEEAIVPGLESHGIPARAAWQASLS